MKMKGHSARRIVNNPNRITTAETLSHHHLGLDMAKHDQFTRIMVSTEPHGFGKIIMTDLYNYATYRSHNHKPSFNHLKTSIRLKMNKI
jgi:hypothetical protein